MTIVTMIDRRGTVRAVLSYGDVLDAAARLAATAGWTSCVRRDAVPRVTPPRGTDQ